MKKTMKTHERAAKAAQGKERLEWRNSLKTMYWTPRIPVRLSGTKWREHLLQRFRQALEGRLVAGAETRYLREVKINLRLEVSLSEAERKAGRIEHLPRDKAPASGESGLEMKRKQQHEHQHRHAA